MKKSICHQTQISQPLSVCCCLPPATLVKFSDEATETVARDKLLAVQLEARLGRGVVVLEPLFDGAALVRMAIHLSAFAAGRVKAMGKCAGTGPRFIA